MPLTHGKNVGEDFDNDLYVFKQSRQGVLKSKTQFVLWQLLSTPSFLRSQTTQQRRTADEQVVNDS